MYIVPRPYICPVCKTKSYSNQPASACMKCFAEFIAKHVPTVVPDPDGKPFDNNSQVSYC